MKFHFVNKFQSSKAATDHRRRRLVPQAHGRHYYKFREHPAEFEHDGYFSMMMLVTVLQQDLGVHYNPARARLPTGPPEASDKFFANSQDVFIHGLVREGGTGTCSSMRVLLVSVGRRLG